MELEKMSIKWTKIEEIKSSGLKLHNFNSWFGAHDDNWRVLGFNWAHWKSKGTKQEWENDLNLLQRSLRTNLELVANYTNGTGSKEKVCAFMKNYRAPTLFDSNSYRDMILSSILSKAILENRPHNTQKKHHKEYVY